MPTVYNLQRWVIIASLFSSGALIVFFLLCRSLLGYPLEPEQTKALIQVAVPPFFGYLSLAVRNAVANQDNSAPARTIPRLLPLLLKGTAALYFVILAVSLLAYYLANAPAAASKGDTGNMSFSDLSWWICAGLALQTATFGVIVGFLFGVEGNPAPTPLKVDKPK